MAKQKDFWFKFYPQKWLAGTAFMTFEERGFYLHLLMLQHQSGHIPEKTVRFLLGSSSVSVWDTVSEKFVKDEHGNYYNEFLEEQIAERAKNSETNIANGTLGGRPRKDKTETKPNGYDLGSENGQNKNRNETQTKTESNSISISISNNSTTEHPYKEESTALSYQGGAGGGLNDNIFPEFLIAFGAAYAKTGKRGAVEQAARDAVREIGGNAKDAMLQLCQQAQDYVAWYRKSNPKDPPLQYMPEPQTWLIQGMYAEDWKFKLSQIVNSSKQNGRLPKFLDNPNKKP